METKTAIKALSALAHEHRLAVYRLLVESGPRGVSAGDIAEKIGVPPSSLTFHTQALVRAGLVTQRRVGRQLIYTADFSAMNDLVVYLTENCCGRGANACTVACNPAIAPAAPAARDQRKRASA